MSVAEIWLRDLDLSPYICLFGAAGSVVVGPAWAAIVLCALGVIAAWARRRYGWRALQRHRRRHGLL